MSKVRFIALISTILIIVSSFVFAHTVKTNENFIEKSDQTIEPVHLVQSMFPKSEIESIATNHWKVYADKEHYNELRLEQIVFDRFINETEDIGQFLVVLRVPKDVASHQGGFYHLYLAIFNSKHELISPVEEIISDDGELSFYEGEDKTYIMFVGSTTFQGWTEYNGSLYDVNKNEWKKIFPEDKFWDNRKAVIGPNSLYLFKRKTVEQEGRLIPESSFEFEAELPWKPEHHQFEYKG